MMTLTELFQPGDFACDYEKSPPENYVGEVTKVTDGGLTIRVHGKETQFSKEESEKMVQSHPPHPKNPMAGLPLDPEVWDTHHSLAFSQREHKTLRNKEGDARSQLAELLQCPATWPFIIAKTKELQLNSHAKHHS